jgi:D-alanyl-D-alanine carboxypeptidase-like protein
VSSAIEALIPELQQPCRDLVDLAGAAGVQPRITSTLRSHSQQASLYKRFISGNSAYPAAPPGRSAHEFGYAFDMIVAGSENQTDLGSVWRSWGGVWGPNDAIHFEYPGFDPDSASEVVLPQSTAESLVSLPAPLSLTLAQLLAENFPGLPPEVANAVLHPWMGLDWLIPQPLLDLRAKLFGI